VRAHYTRPVTDEAGNLLPNVQVTIYQPATTTPISSVVYSTDTGNNILSNPWVASSGVIDFYLDNPQRVRIGTVQGGLAVQYAEDVDVLAAGADSQHVGPGSNSLEIGVGAVSAGNQSTALGPTAASPGVQSTAVGSASNAVGDHSVAAGTASTSGNSEIAVGNGSSTSGGDSFAIGHTASATGASSGALGTNASSTYPHSTAIGADSAVTQANQIMMGTAADVTEIPFGSAVVLSSPDGTRYFLRVDNGGALDTELL
jgi:hypothetical protein